MFLPMKQPLNVWLVCFVKEQLEVQVGWRGPCLFIRVRSRCLAVWFVYICSRQTFGFFLLWLV